MNFEFKPGDIVRVKTGGPAMTIARVCGDVATVVWFARIGTDGDWSGPMDGQYPFCTLEYTETDL